MNDVISSPVICPVLVGRDEVLAALVRIVDGGEGPRTVLISGEAGVGKSRLLRELSTHAHAAGWDVVRAEFFERDEAVPYAGFRRMRRETAGLALEPVPGLAAVLGLAAPGHGREPEGDEAETDRAGLTASLAEAVASLAARTPALMIFEDVHWADEASLDVLLALARAPGQAVLCLTYRPEDAPDALGAFLAEVDRERLAAETRLRRLSLGEVETMARAIAGSRGPIRADLLHRLFTLSEGNPFLVEEFLRSLTDQLGDIDAPGGAASAPPDIPRSVNEAVRRRTRWLSEGAARLLNVAAVAGTRFDFDLIREVAGVDDAALGPQLKELIMAGLIVEEAPDVFVFRHAITREAVRSTLLSRERRALSGQLAAAMERLHGDVDEHIEDLAWHYHAAGNAEKAFTHARRAGQRALDLFSPAAAIEHFTRAIEAAESLAGADRGEVHRLRASGYEAIGAFELARADLEQAIADADAWVRWRAFLQLGLLWASRDYARARPYYLQAVEVARTLDDPSALGQSLERLGNWHSNIGDFEAARRLGDEGIALLREAGDARALARALDLLGMTCIQGLQLAAAVSYYEEAARLLAEADDRLILSSTLSSTQIAATTYQTGIVPPAIALRAGSALGERGLAIARECGAPAAVAYSLWQLSFALGPQGEYGRALACAEEALAIAREIEHVQWEIGALCALAAIDLDLLQPERARPRLEAANSLTAELGSTTWEGQVNSLLIDAALASGDVASAAALFDKKAPDAPGGFRTRFIYAAGAELALARGEVGRALHMVEALETAAEESVPGGYSVRLGWLRGRTLLAAGDAGGAVLALERATAEARSQGQAWLEWRAAAALAGAHLAAGDRDRGLECAAAAAELIRALGERAPVSHREAFLERATAQLPASLRARPSRRGLGGLTGREAEVAAMVARGRTNRDIAGELVLSARTVETHVANALGKLGFTSRAQLAAWAANHGLAGESGAAPARESP